MEIDLNNSVPIFRQIVDGICAAIAAGIYKPGELIPSVRQQAVTLLVNPNTVQRAYEQLERDGILNTRRGSGMEVAQGAPAAALARTSQAVQQSLAQAIEQGRSARLPRTTIDTLYRKAWNGDRPGGQQ
jgi:GntR family transcriptional regulator